MFKPFRAGSCLRSMLSVSAALWSAVATSAAVGDVVVKAGGTCCAAARNRARNSVAWCGSEQELMTQLIYIDGNERRSAAMIGRPSCAVRASTSPVSLA